MGAVANPQTMRALGALHDANACRFHSCSNSSIISSFSKLLRAMDSVAPTDAELLRAIAMAIRGQRCAWAHLFSKTRVAECE